MNKHAREPEFEPGVERDIVVPTEDPDRTLHYTELPHEASRFDAGTGQGTHTGSTWGEELQEHPILDGATESAIVEEQTTNDYKGGGEPSAVYSQPALTSASSSRWLLAGIVSAILIAIPLVWLLQFNAVISGIGMVVVLILLLAMVFVRKRVVRPDRRKGLTSEAFLLVLMWIVGIAAAIATIAVEMEQILPIMENIPG